MKESGRPILRNAMQGELGPDGSAGWGDRGAPLAEERIRDAYDRVLRACRFSGLAACDGADIAQDLFLWLVRHPERSSLLSPACIGAVVANYVMRYRRRSHIRKARERSSFEVSSAKAWSAPTCDETTLSIERLTRLLPTTECIVLKELRFGATWAEATARAGIPPGSRDWLRKRMAEHVRRAFRPRASAPDVCAPHPRLRRRRGAEPLRRDAASRVQIPSTCLAAKKQNGRGVNQPPA